MFTSKAFLRATEFLSPVVRGLDSTNVKSKAFFSISFVLSSIKANFLKVISYHTVVAQQNENLKAD